MKLFEIGHSFVRPALAVAVSACLVAVSPGAEPGAVKLRDVFKDDFLVGVALNTAQVDGRNAKAGEIAGSQFSAVTAENDMKWQSLHPQPGHYRFDAADAYVKFAREHRMEVIGHTLVWHSQTPDWVFKGEGGGEATRDELLKRMKDHIETVVGRYKGKIHGWDVVNEAVSDGPEGLRNSPWRRIIGDDFIEQAFRFAHAADPQAELYYNDYGMVNRPKRDRAIRMLKNLLDHGVPVKAVGMQGHYSLKWPQAGEVDQAIKDFAALGLKVMITELDVDVLPSKGDPSVADISRKEGADSKLDPYVKGLPDEMQRTLADRYAALFSVFVARREEITRVTFWGLDDGQSWLNHFPIRGRTNHPLLIGRDLRPKPAFFAVLRTGQSLPKSP